MPMTPRPVLGLKAVFGQAMGSRTSHTHTQVDMSVSLAHSKKGTNKSRDTTCNQSSPGKTVEGQTARLSCIKIISP